MADPLALDDDVEEEDENEVATEDGEQGAEGAEGAETIPKKKRSRPGLAKDSATMLWLPHGTRNISTR